MNMMLEMDMIRKVYFQLIVIIDGFSIGGATVQARE